MISSLLLRLSQGVISETVIMRGGLGRGAVIGLVVGAVLLGVLVLLPSALAGSFYEVTDPLVYLGIPLLFGSGAVGALLAAWRRPVDGQTRSVVTALAIALCVLALLLALMTLAG